MVELRRDASACAAPRCRGPVARIAVLDATVAGTRVRGRTRPARQVPVGLTGFVPGLPNLTNDSQSWPCGWISALTCEFLACSRRICALNRGRRVTYLRGRIAVALGRRQEAVDRDAGSGLGGELGPGPVGVPRL